MVRLKRGFGFSGKKVFLILIIAIVLTWLIFFTGIIKKNCKQDKECFDEAIKKCKSAKFINLIDNSYYIYTIKGEKSNNCVLKIKLEKMAVGTPVDLLEKFEGKSMVCYIPKSNLDKSIEEIPNVINFCTGPLKESIYELIIERLYGLVIKNMGDIISQVQEQLYEIK